MVQPEVLFCTELVGLQVFDTRRRLIGRVKDAALVPIINPVRVDRFLVGGQWAWLTVRFDQVQRLSLDGIYLRDEQLTPYHSDEYMLRIVRDLLDQQIIDAHGRKVVRVNDVTFEIKQAGSFQYLDVLEVDIGVRSIFRRLLQGVIPASWTRKLQKPIAPNSIRWEYCNIVEPDPQRRLRLNITHTALERMHPADLAEIVEDLSPEDREAIIENLDAEVAAEALSAMDPSVQASILESIDTDKAAAIIDEMAPDEAAHALADLEEETSSEILEEVTEETRAEVGEIVEYHEHTAGFLMNTNFVALPENASVDDAVRFLRTKNDELDKVNTLFLTSSDDGSLCGTVMVTRLLVAGPEQTLRELAADNIVKVDVYEKEARVTALFDKYSLLSLPVTSGDGRVIGVITADHVISALCER
ncbi:MAG: magnesium transporter [Bryobacteraceae bacterium]|nr:magnesium transporter [Bryobacteraceae bacterium]